LSWLFGRWGLAFCWTILEHVILLFYASHNSWGDRDMSPHPAFSVEMSSHELSAWPGTAILRTSASYVPGMIVTCHYTQSSVEMGSHKLFTWAGHEPKSSQCPPPEQLGLQVWATGAWMGLRLLKITDTGFVQCHYSMAVCLRFSHDDSKVAPVF
jgi:hypothetical protein